MRPNVREHRTFQNIRVTIPSRPTCGVPILRTFAHSSPFGTYLLTLCIVIYTTRQTHMSIDEIVCKLKDSSSFISCALHVFLSCLFLCKEPPTCPIMVHREFWPRHKHLQAMLRIMLERKKRKPKALKMTGAMIVKYSSNGIVQAVNK